MGCWTKGWFVIRQHPSDGALRFVEKLSLNGRPGGRLRDLPAGRRLHA